MTALLVSAAFLTPAARGGEPAGVTDETASQLAKKLTEKGAATFDTRNAEAMAASYLEDGEVTLIGKGEAGYDSKTHKGREEITTLYRDFFKDADVIKSRNEVEMARLLQPDLLVIYGTFEIQKGSQTSRFPFFQVRVKKGDDWRISSLQLFIVPPKS